MKIVCAWCGKDMGEKDGKGVAGVSHSICEECYEKSFVITKGDSCFHDNDKGLLIAMDCIGGVS